MLSSVLKSYTVGTSLKLEDVVILNQVNNFNLTLMSIRLSECLTFCLPVQLSIHYHFINFYQHQCECSARDFCGRADQVPHHLQLLWHGLLWRAVWLHGRMLHGDLLLLSNEWKLLPLLSFRTELVSRTEYLHPGLSVWLPVFESNNYDNRYYRYYYLPLANYY